MRSGWYLAGVDAGRLVAGHTDLRVAGFFAELGRTNSLAEASRGFVWRLQDEAGNATNILPAISHGLARLWKLANVGLSTRAFTFKSRFPAPGLDGPPVDLQPDPWCAGRA